MHNGMDNIKRKKERKKDEDCDDELLQHRNCHAKWSAMEGPDL